MSIFIAGVFSILEMSVRRLLSRLGSRAMAQWQSVQSPGRRAPNLRLSSLVSKPPDQPPPAERLPPRGLDVEGHQLGPPPHHQQSSDHQEGLRKQPELGMGLLVHH